MGFQAILASPLSLPHFHLAMRFKMRECSLVQGIYLRVTLAEINSFSVFLIVELVQSKLLGLGLPKCLLDLVLVKAVVCWAIVRVRISETRFFTKNFPLLFFTHFYLSRRSFPRWGLV